MTPRPTPASAHNLQMTPDRRRALHKILHDVNKSNTNKYYTADVDKLNRDQWWPLMFLLANKEDTFVTSAVIQECLRWRKAARVRDLRLMIFEGKKLPMYMRGSDVYGNEILWIDMANHAASDRSIDGLLIFWLEYNLMYNNLAQMTIVVDLTTPDTFDFTFFKFLRHAFKYLYPNCLGEIILYNPTPRLSAAVRVFQSWLASFDFAMAHEITQLDDILAFVRKENLPPSMNGEDNFTMADVVHDLPDKLWENAHADEQPYVRNDTTGVCLGIDNCEHHADALSATASNIDSFVSYRRSVQFKPVDAPPSPENSRSGDMNLSNGNARNTSLPRRVSNLPTVLRDVYNQRMNSAPVDWFSRGFATITPNQQLSLKEFPNEADPVDIIVIKNTDQTRGLLFKIKTTSPEKFRVRPSVGFIPPGRSDFVRIFLQNEYKATLKNERFLIMGVRTNEENTETFGALWSDAEEFDKLEKQIGCVLQSSTRALESSYSNDIKSDFYTSDALSYSPGIDSTVEIAELRRRIAELDRRQMFVIFMLLFLVVVHFLSVVYFRSSIDGLSDSLKEYAGFSPSYSHSDL